MKLAPNAGSKTSWVWLAMDAAEGEPKFEQLAIRFKLEETAFKFKEVFEYCQEKLNGNGDGGNVVEEEVDNGNVKYNIYVWMFLPLSPLSQKVIV